jgi:hypothetical protein
MRMPLTGVAGNNLGNLFKASDLDLKILITYCWITRLGEHQRQSSFLQMPPCAKQCHSRFLTVEIVHSIPAFFTRD